MNTPTTPASSSTSVLGSETGVVGEVIVTLPLWRLAPIELRFESSKNTFERSIALVPGARPVSVRIASVPLPSTPGPEPSSVSAVKATVPPTLSIVPGMKNVAPPPGRKVPSTMETAERRLGAKLRSNWKAYRSVTLAMFTSSVTLLPTLRIDDAGSMLKVGIESAKVGSEKTDAKNTPAIIPATLKRFMFFSFAQKG
jgi:hypothetical protein